MIPNTLFHLFAASAPTIQTHVTVTCVSILLAFHVTKHALRAAESVARLFAVFSRNPEYVDRLERLAMGGRHHGSRMPHRGRVGFVECSQRHSIHPLLGCRPPALGDPLSPRRPGVTEIDLGRHASWQRNPDHECGHDDLRDIQPQP